MCSKARAEIISKIFNNSVQLECAMVRRHVEKLAFKRQACDNGANVEGM